MQKARVGSPMEFSAFVGKGPIPRESWARPYLIITFGMADGTIRVHPASTEVASVAEAELALVVADETCRRMCGTVVTEGASWHLPSDMRAMVAAIHDTQLRGPSREAFRNAKSVELLCATFQNIEDGALVAADGSGGLSELDARRIATARRLIDERWSEKLSLSLIARECGINRAKLTREFRTVFDCSVTDAIAARRMNGARDMILATDLPISSIGYRCGYTNTASFTRAFSRRFGLAPTRLRADRPVA